MKKLTEYLIENKKRYNFKVKMAGECSAESQKKLKLTLDKYKVEHFEKVRSIPLQRVHQDFPTLSNIEVHVFDVTLEYPVTIPELEQDLRAAGFNSETFRVRSSTSPAEVDSAIDTARELSDPKPALLHTEELDQVDKKGQDDLQSSYYGDKYNSSFLQDLQRAADERKKELGHDGQDVDVLGSALKETDKSGKLSPVGSK